MNLTKIADNLYADRKALIERYPGYWTLTKDLMLVPERHDFANKMHLYGFNTQMDPRPIQLLILIGIKIIAKSKHASALLV